jgi:SSS family solute:Na+ symporter
MDYSIMLIYVGAVLGIGQALRKYMKSSSDFFLSGRSIPAWVTGLAFISANLGALELVGMAASGAKYGMMTCHFYWIGAILAMTFLSVFMMPFYYGSKARSVPEYLNMRFDGRVRCLNSITFAVMTVFASGISMNALAKLLQSLLGWDYHLSLWICSGVVLLYVLKGGLTSAIYTEVLQFFMIVLGFSPVVYLGLKEVGGWTVLKGMLTGVATNPASIGVGDKAFQPDAWTGAWSPMIQGASANPMGVDLFAMVFGLGFVLAFGYWCTNFLVVQRAMAAKDMSAARRTPLIGAIPKMLIPALVILPGMIAAGLAFSNKDNKDGYRLPPKVIAESAYVNVVAAVKHVAATGVTGEAAVQEIAKAAGLKMMSGKVDAIIKASPNLSDADITARVQNAVAENDYDGVILSLIKRYCPTGLLGLALTALLASFMSGMAGNVTAFNTIWTYDLYQAYLAKGKSDAHYMWMGKAATVAGILISIGCAYFAAMYNNAMDVIQLVFGFVNAPLFATFLLGMFWKRITATGAFWGLLLGTTTSAIFHALTLAIGNAPGVKGGYLGVVQSFPSEMAQNFWLASFAFLTCLVLTTVLSLATKQNKTDAELTGLVYSLTPRIPQADEAWYMRPGVQALALLGVCLVLNIIFW